MKICTKSLADSASSLYGMTVEIAPDTAYNLSKLTISQLTFYQGGQDLDKEKQLHFQIHRTSRLIKRYIDSTHTKSYIDNVTGNHGYIIGFIYENRDRDIFQRDIEKEFNLRGSTVTNMLNLMEKNGLIERKSVDGDRRLKKIVLTEKALEIQQLVIRDFEKLEKTVSKGIDPKDIEVFFSVLNQINTNIKEVSEHD